MRYYDFIYDYVPHEDEVADLQVLYSVPRESEVRVEPYEDQKWRLVLSW